MAWQSAVETSRLKSLHYYKILDTLPEQAFDDMTLLASQICDTPIAMMSFVDSERAWFKSRVGLDVAETPRNIAFCHHAIRHDGIFMIPDATLDPVFQANELVTGPLGFRFYAGAILKTRWGDVIGTLCVVDRRARELTNEQQQALAALSRQVMQLLDFRLMQLEYGEMSRKAENERVASDSARINLETFLYEAPISIAILEGPEHRFTHANDPYLRLVGHRDLIGLTIREAFPDLADQPFYELLDEVYRTGIPYIAKEVPVDLGLKGQKERVFVDFTYSPRLDPYGKIGGISVTSVDITKQVKARLDVEEKESFLRLITDSVPAHIAYVDRQLRLQFVNEYSIKYFRRSRGELVGLPIRDLIGEELFNDRKKNYEQVLEGLPLQFKVRSYDGAQKAHIMHNSAIPDIDEDGTVRGFILIAYDQTEEESLKLDLENARVKAEAANNAKSAFLANMSHEIRTPLGAIMGFVSLLRDGHQTPEENEQYLQIIERNTAQVVRIIDDILDLSKVEAGRMSIEAIPFSLHELITDFSSLMTFKAKDKGIDFTIHADTPLPATVVSDPTRLRQILTNIVGNAIKFTKRGAVMMSIAYAESKLRFDIKDTGIGISEESTGRLFQAFSQADLSTTRKFGGTGLGLVLTRNVARVLGGDFWLESSKEGVGSHFVAEIKVETSVESAAMMARGYFDFGTRKVELAASEDHRLRGKRMLIVDDSPDNQLLIRKILKRAGVEVELADDGVQGVERALAESFDIILMDVQMPRMDGYAAVAELRRRDFCQPIIAITAHAMKEERDKCLEAGYTAFVSKPIHRQELLEVLKKHVGE